MATVVTPTTAAKYIAAVWTREIEKPFYKSLFAADLVTRRDSLVTGGGNTVHVPFLSSYNARIKTPGTAVTYDANTETEITISINKYYYLAFVLEYITLTQSNYNLQAMYRGAQAEALSRQIDGDLLGLHASATTNVSAGATVDDADVLAAVSALDSLDVPQTDRSAIVGYKTMNDLRNINKYSTYDQTGQTGLAVSNSALVPRVYGIDIHMSNNVVDDLTNTHNLVFHKSAMSLALQQPPKYLMEESVDEIGLKTVLWCLYGVAVERAGALVDVERTS